MPKRTIKQTLESLPGAPRGTPGYSPSARRELAARTIERKHGDALAAIAAIAWGSGDEGIRLRALQALASYLYPQLKAVELSGPDGDRLVVEVRRAATEDATQALPASPPPA